MTLLDGVVVKVVHDHEVLTEIQDAQPDVDGAVSRSLVLRMCTTARLSLNTLKVTKLGFELWWGASSSPRTSFTLPRFRRFCIVLPKAELFMSLNRSFSNYALAFFLSSVLNAMYGINHSLWSNSIIM